MCKHRATSVANMIQKKLLENFQLFRRLVLWHECSLMYTLKTFRKVLGFFRSLHSQIRSTCVPFPTHAEWPIHREFSEHISKSNKRGYTNEPLQSYTKHPGKRQTLFKQEPCNFVQLLSELKFAVTDLTTISEFDFCVSFSGLTLFL